MGFIMALNIAIYGYDTDVGKIFIELLNNSNLSFDNVYPLSPLDGDFDAISIKNKNYLAFDVFIILVKIFMISFTLSFYNYQSKIKALFLYNII